MRTPEQKLWDRFRKLFGNRILLQRHEDRLAAGIPDVSYAYNGHFGWIELKVGTFNQDKRQVRIPHFTKKQQKTLREWANHGDHCYMLLQVGYQVFLIGGASAAILGSGPLTLTNIQKVAIGWSPLDTWGEAADKWLLSL